MGSRTLLILPEGHAEGGEAVQRHRRGLLDGGARFHDGEAERDGFLMGLRLSSGLI